MNLLDRHIFKSVLFTCGAAVLLFVFVLMLGNAIKDLLTPVVAGQLSWGVVVRLTLRLLPAVAPFALPIGMLTGVLLTLGRLSADSEITAMRGAGISLFRIARPIYVLGVLAAAAAFYANFEAMPRARVAYEREFAAALRTNPLSFIVPNTFIRQFRGYVVYVGARAGNVLHDVWLWKLDDQGRVTSFERSETGRINYDEKDNTLLLTMTPAQIETRDREDPENFTRSPIVNLFGLGRLDSISLDRLFGRGAVHVKQDWLTYGELIAERGRLAQAPAEGTPKDAARRRMKLELVIQNKFNFALAAFSFALIGVPLGIKVSRRETSANLGVAVLLFLGYYFATVVVGWLDPYPEYRPDLLLWVPNLALIGIGGWMFRRIER